MNKIIYFSDEELQQLGYKQNGRDLKVADEEYIIIRAVDGKYKRGYEVVKK